jgi:hypothetical protein
VVHIHLVVDGRKQRTVALGGLGSEPLGGARQHPLEAGGIGRQQQHRVLVAHPGQIPQHRRGPLGIALDEA